MQQIFLQEMTYFSENPREGEQKKMDNQVMGYVEKTSAHNITYDYILPTSMFFNSINHNSGMSFELLETLLQQDLKPIPQYIAKE